MMRALFSKVVTGSMIAGAAFLVAACAAAEDAAMNNAGTAISSDPDHIPTPEEREAAQP